MINKHSYLIIFYWISVEKTLFFVGEKNSRYRPPVVSDHDHVAAELEHVGERHQIGDAIAQPT